MPIRRTVFSRGRRSASLLLVATLLAAPAFAKETPRLQRLEGLSESSGSFLAAMSAQGNRDLRAAAGFFRELLRTDPNNASLLERAFVSELGDGNLTEAFRHAESAIARSSTNPLAQATLGVRSIKLRQYQTARSHLAKAGGARGRNADLTVALLTAWTHVGSGDLKRALDIVERFNDPQLEAYRNFFGGMMAEVAGNKAEAAKRLMAAYRAEPGTLRVADAYARNLSRAGNREDALKVYGEWENRNSGQPFVKKQLDELRAGRVLPPLATNVAEGAAEVLYGLGAASGGRESETSLIFMQLANYLNPDDDLVKVSIGELFESMRQWERSGEVFSKIANDSPYRTRSLLGRVIAYERLEKTEDAIGTLTTLLSETPDELDAVDMLGGLYRTKKDMPKAIAVYSAALGRIAKPEAPHWNLYFGRGVAYERNKEWALAEPDFLKALELLPANTTSARAKYERAQVLNYLAYSWVDQGLNIEKSFEMLKQAVALAPEDGAIVDSLGWAYYRLGKFDEATRELERAIELKPGDPTINDHLGDAYWKVGRRSEAYFKWNHARALKPDAEDLPKILSKIERGLDDPVPPVPSELIKPADLPKPADPARPNGG